MPQDDANQEKEILVKVPCLTGYKPVRVAERLYTCPLCDYKSSFRTAVVGHLPAHSDDRPFKCNSCDYDTKRSSDLRKHKQCKHGRIAVLRAKAKALKEAAAEDGCSASVMDILGGDFSGVGDYGSYGYMPPPLPTSEEDEEQGTWPEDSPAGSKNGNQSNVDWMNSSLPELDLANVELTQIGPGRSDGVLALNEQLAIKSEENHVDNSGKAECSNEAGKASQASQNHNGSLPNLRSAKRKTESPNGGCSSQTPFDPKRSRESSTRTQTTKGRLCEFCNVLYFDSALYCLHAGLHSAENPWKCNLCHNLFNDVYGFTSHIITGHANISS